jgi:GT2 family glycosyltransferase
MPERSTTATGSLISVVIATYNRQDALSTLLKDLDAQTLETGAFEVVVVDDGSKVPAEKPKEPMRYPLTLIRQENAGAAAARHRGIEAAAGEVIVIVDDDMRIGPDFLAAHRNEHDRGATLVLGLIAPDSKIEAKPLFERMHQQLLAKLVAMYERDPSSVRGTQVCTGNVSFRRAAYLAVGGFDLSLKRSEDRDLGVRLERAGAKLAFSGAAKVTHESDHVDDNVWLKRNFLYGIYDTRIAKKHPDVPRANPWHFLSLVSPLSRPVLLSVVAVPQLGRPLATAVLKAAHACEGAGFERAAIAGATLCYGIEYFHGVREELGSLLSTAIDLRAYRKRWGGKKV